MAAERTLRVLAVSTTDRGGGAERIAAAIARGAHERGLTAWLAVGRQLGDDPHVLAIPDRDRTAGGAWARLCWGVHDALAVRAGTGPGGFPRSASGGSPWVSRARNALRRAANPRAFAAWLSGLEDFDFPGSHGLLSLPPAPPDLVHLHNLHGRYFDLRALPAIARRAPAILTLHDMWLLTGHCAHAFGCDRWERGCGACPDLRIYPSIPRDGSAANWRRKRDLVAACRVRIAAPCAWLLERARRSHLAPSIEEARLIPHGVDLRVFAPGDRGAARRALGLPERGAVVLVLADGLRRDSMWRDAETLRGALARLGERRGAEPPLVVALGATAPDERFGDVTVRHAPYAAEPEELARHYQAADLFLYAARADTFPTTILESLACGTPVVATAVGGIPEQIHGHLPAGGPEAASGLLPGGPDEATGVLTPAGDAEALGGAAAAVLADRPHRERLARNAARDARSRFDAERMIGAYVDWYREIAERVPR